VGGIKMKISDMIKLKSSGPMRRKSFMYNMHAAGNKTSGLAMKRLVADGNILRQDRVNNIEKTYNKCLEDVKLIFKRAEIDFGIMPAYNHLQEMIKDLIDDLLPGNIEVMKIFMKREDGEYLPVHSINVTFLSIMIGMWLNYNISGLNNLAHAAILHDIGMLKFKHMVLKPKTFNKHEREEVDLHPNLSSNFAGQIPGMNKQVPEVILLHHRRLNNHNMNINEHSQIIGLADVFEAMTHPRAYRSALEPHEAIEIIIGSMSKSFNQSIIKALVDNIGIYPPGTWVWLDTKEIGLVIDTNSGSPLSPKINIMFDNNMQQLSCVRTVDLLKHRHIHIMKPLDEEDKIRLKDMLN
jgi:HD-GYP domain-containing protein (c-di-GMP phosphodiesterase class II)